MALLFDKRINWIEVDFSRWGNANREDTTKFEIIKEATFNEKSIQFQYVSSNGELTERKIDPLKLIYKRHDWYLYGFCHLREDFRLFKITRMAQLRALSQAFLREYRGFNVLPI